MRGYRRGRERGEGIQEGGGREVRGYRRGRERGEGIQEG